MRIVSVDVISDLHLDFYFKENAPINEKHILKTFDKIFENIFSDILIIAGDIGHYNFQTVSIIEILQKNYYDNIICVLGNHDYYLFNNTQKNKYGNSLNKANDLRNKLNSLNGVYCLDGDIVEINGIKFGGCDGWYDGYYTTLIDPSKNPIELWRQTMNDAKYITNIDDFYDLLLDEKKKLDNIIEKSDVIITHISPSTKNEHLPEYKRDDAITGFYTFFGDDYLKKTNASHWIYGHMHEGFEYESYGVKCLSNPFGYPKQNKDFKIKTFFAIENKYINKEGVVKLQAMKNELYMDSNIDYRDAEISEKCIEDLIKIMEKR